MRILFITPTLAAYHFIRPLCLKLLDTGHEIHFASSSFKFSDDQEIDSRIVFHRIILPRGANPTAHLVAAWRLKRLINNLRPDFIDAHYAAAMLTVALARRRHWPTVVVATIHGLRFPTQFGFRRRLERFAETWAAKRMDEVYVLNFDDHEAMADAGIKNVSTIKSCGLGCDLDRFNIERFCIEQRIKLRNELGISKGDLVCIFVGRFVEFKGFTIAVKAFLDVADRNHQMRLLLCGAYDDLHPSGFRDSDLESIKQDCRIINLGWISDVERVLAISDICLFPSEREGMPVNLMEALAMGVPVISSDTRGCKDVVTHEWDGLVVRSRHSEAVAEALERLRSNPTERQQFARNAIEGRARFDQKHFVEERYLSITTSQTSGSNELH